MGWDAERTVMRWEDLGWDAERTVMLSLRGTGSHNVQAMVRSDRADALESLHSALQCQ